MERGSVHHSSRVGNLRSANHVPSMRPLHDTPHEPAFNIAHPTLPHNIGRDVERVSRALLQPLMPHTIRKDTPLLCPVQNPASTPLLVFARKHAWMALHALAQCTARLLLAHQQKQGRQRAGGSGVGEQEGMREDWGVYCALADLGMEERVKGGWLHGVEPDRATWQAAHRAFTQAFVEPPDTAQQKKLTKLLKRPLPKEVADGLFTYDGFLHGLGRMGLSA